jgi:predicted N-acetyltransferase YhbS
VIRVEPHAGPRAELRPLFALAEDSARELNSYIDDGRAFVAREGDRIVGHLQLTERGSGELEIRNMAVAEAYQGRGIGSELVGAAIAFAAREGCSKIHVATAAADVGNLRFYQRLGFRMRAIERDAFTAAAGYDEVVIDGIELRDRVWLERPLP